MADAPNPEILNVVIKECGRYLLEGRKATLEIYRGMHDEIHATLRPEIGRPLSWPVRTIERDGSNLEIQGPNTFWRFTVVDHDLDDPRR